MFAASLAGSICNVCRLLAGTLASNATTSWCTTRPIKDGAGLHDQAYYFMEPVCSAAQTCQTPHHFVSPIVLRKLFGAMRANVSIDLMPCNLPVGMLGLTADLYGLRSLLNRRNSVNASQTPGHCPRPRRPGAAFPLYKLWQCWRALATLENYLL